MEGEHVLGFQRDAIRRTGAELVGFQMCRIPLGVHGARLRGPHMSAVRPVTPARGPSPAVPLPRDGLPPTIRL
jgi:hypothetical protein